MSQAADNGTSDGASQFTLGPMALADEPGRGGGGGAGSQSNGLGTMGAGQSSLTGQDGDDSAELPNETIDVLRNIVLNEYFSPEILPYESESIESVRQLVTTQTELVDAEEDDEEVDQLSFESQLKRMELDRINYQLRQYYRVRIKKIERFIMHIFKGDGPYDLLSEAEKRFAVGYSDLIEDHFKKAFLSLLPQRLQVMEKDGNVDHATPPKLDRFVFCRVRNTVGPYVIGEDATDDSLDLNRGDTLCIRYKSVRDLLKNGHVELLWKCFRDNN